MRASLWSLLSCTLLLSPQRFATAQTASAAHSPGAPPTQSVANDQLSPSAAYQEALHPLEVTRQNIANWSDVEIAAMNVAIGKARDGCKSRKPEAYTGGPLLDLAKLCSLGQQWPLVVTAASRYISEPAQPKPLLAEAYIGQTEALLRMKDEPGALSSAIAMLKAVPYTSEVGDCIDETFTYMRFVHTDDALQLAQARQPLLLASIRGSDAPPAPTGVAGPASTASAAQSTVNLSQMYAQGLLLPALQQISGHAAEVADTVTALDAALPQALSPDDKLRIAEQRRRYALLGKPLGAIHPITSLSSPPDRLPDLPANSAITAMLLFPDWCAQCVKMGPLLPPTVFTVEGHSAYVYGLLAQTLPAKKPDPTPPNTGFNPAYAAALMAETPTVTVPPAMLGRFGTDEYPLMMLTDAHGILRVLQPVNAQDLQPGGDVDSAIALVARHFSPVPKITGTPPDKPSTPGNAAPQAPH